MNASPKLQRAGRAFLLRLVAENGPDEAARALRSLSDEVEGLSAGHPPASMDLETDLESAINSEILIILSG